MSKFYAKRNIGLAEIQIVVGDIATQPDVDAIVNASSVKLRMGSGVSGAIFRAAGVQELTQACAALAPIEVGGAVITPGFNLPCRYIIHCCGPRYIENSENKQGLASCYWNVLNLAETKQITSLAVPAISTGAFGFPIEEAAQICINSIKEFSPDFSVVKVVRFVVVGEITAAVYARYLLEELPISDRATKVEFDVYFSQAQFLRIRKGFIGDQDAKWVFYFDDPWLYVFRGGRWVDDCYIYIKLCPAGMAWHVSEAWIDKLFHGGDDREAIHFLYYIIYDYFLHEDGHASKIHLAGFHSMSYQVLPSGRAKLEISSSPLFADEIRNLGLNLSSVRLN